MRKRITLAIDDELDHMRAARIPREKKQKKPIARFSKKLLSKRAEEKKLVSSDGDTLKEQWFKARRLEMTGVCACGCGEPSQKHDNINFRCSAAHIFPKRFFPSVEYHPLNWVERRFWAGITGTTACHSYMDDTSMNRWVNFEDWESIRVKFMILAPLLTQEEKEHKFYTELEKLVFNN